MPDAKKNRTIVQTPGPAKVVSYKGLLSQPPDFPGTLNDQVKTALSKISDGISDCTPDGIETAVAYSLASWKKAISEIELYVFSSLSQWEVLDRIAHLPIEELGEADFVIRPVSLEEWTKNVKRKGPIYRHVKKRGILMYSKEYD